MNIIIKVNTTYEDEIKKLINADMTEDFVFDANSESIKLFASALLWGNVVSHEIYQKICRTCKTIKADETIEFTDDFTLEEGMEDEEDVHAVVTLTGTTKTLSKKVRKSDTLIQQCVENYKIVRDYIYMED